MADRLHIAIWNRIKKPLKIALSGVRRGLRGKEDGDNVNIVRCKSNLNCHYESPLYNEYILIKKKNGQVPLGDREERWLARR
jgi:hypothetical protein